MIEILKLFLKKPVILKKMYVPWSILFGSFQSAMCEIQFKDIKLAKLYKFKVCHNIIAYTACFKTFGTMLKSVWHIQPFLIQDVFY